MATLIRPATADSKELILKITPKIGKTFSTPELISLVGVDFTLIELMSGDSIVVMKCHEEKTLGKNVLASILSHRGIYGPAIIVEPQEID